MDFVRIAIEEAKKLAQSEQMNPLDQTEQLRYLQKKRERLYRRLSEATKDFNGLMLTTKRKLAVENFGSAIMFPCIRFYEAMQYENVPIVDIFIEITDDGDQSRVICRAECLWQDPTVRLLSGDSDKLMSQLAKQIAMLLKVDGFFDGLLERGE